MTIVKFIVHPALKGRPRFILWPRLQPGMAYYRVVKTIIPAPDLKVGRNFFQHYTLYILNYTLISYKKPPSSSRKRVFKNNSTLKTHNSIQSILGSQVVSGN